MTETKPARLTLKRSERLRESALVARVRHEGEKRSIFPFLIFRLNSPLTFPRLAVAIAKRSGNSVVRNKFRRKIREFFRQNKNLLVGFDYFFYTSANLSKFSSENWQQFLERLKKWSGGKKV